MDVRGVDITKKSFEGVPPTPPGEMRLLAAHYNTQDRKWEAVDSLGRLWVRRYYQFAWQREGEGLFS